MAFIYFSIFLSQIIKNLFQLKFLFELKFLSFFFSFLGVGIFLRINTFFWAIFRFAYESLNFLAFQMFKLLNFWISFCNI